MAGEAPTEMPVVEINLSELYDVACGTDVAAIGKLQSILESYNAEYRLLENYSPDVGSEYYNEEWREFTKRCEEEYDILDKRSWLECAKRYATMVGADAVVYLYDGYESAVAIVWSKEK